MPDVTMCAGTNCLEKEKCHRFTATPDTYQSYFMDTPWNPKTKACEYFWNTEPTEEELETAKEAQRKRLSKLLSCSICKPHRNENAGRKPKRGAQKPKSKTKRGGK